MGVGKEDVVEAACGFFRCVQGVRGGVQWRGGDGAGSDGGDREEASTVHKLHRAHGSTGSVTGSSRRLDERKTWPSLQVNELKSFKNPGWVVFFCLILNLMNDLRSILGVDMGRLAGDLRPICARLAANGCEICGETGDNWECYLVCRVRTLPLLCAKQGNNILRSSKGIILFCTHRHSNCCRS